MNITLIINNYNYGRFLDECLDALVKQSTKPDKIIFVDDGSSDNSISIAKKYINFFDKFFLIEKENGGQLSCFNIAITYVENNDIIFLLDSDDVFPFDFLENAIKNIIEDDNVDICFFEIVKFVNGAEYPIKSSVISDQKSCKITSSSNLTRRTKCWIGSPTSAIALRGKAYKKIFPYHEEKSWITRADDVIIFSSSIIGMTKKYVPSVAILYRIHEDNNFHGKLINDKNNVLRYLSLEKLFCGMCKKAGLESKGSANVAYIEAMLIPKKFHSKFFIPAMFKLKIHKYVEKAFRFIGI